MVCYTNHPALGDTTRSFHMPASDGLRAFFLNGSSCETSSSSLTSSISSQASTLLSNVEDPSSTTSAIPSGVGCSIVPRSILKPPPAPKTVTWVDEFGVRDTIAARNISTKESPCKYPVERHPLGLKEAELSKVQGFCKYPKICRVVSAAALVEAVMGDGESEVKKLEGSAEVNRLESYGKDCHPHSLKGGLGVARSIAQVAVGVFIGVAVASNRR